LSVDDANYGTSSTNVFWYDYGLSSLCDETCRKIEIGNEGSCRADMTGTTCISDEEYICSFDSECSDGCIVESCTYEE